MSRKPSNQKLIPLLRAKTRQLAAIGHRCLGEFSVSDLSDYAQVNQTSIHRYVTGRKDFPDAEARIAAVLGLAVKDLRRKLGLPALRNREPRKTTRRQNEYGAFIESSGG